MSTPPFISWATHADVIDIIAKVERRLGEEPDMGQRGVILNTEIIEWERRHQVTELVFLGQSSRPLDPPCLTPMQIERVLQALQTIHRRLQREARAAVAA